MRFHSGYAGYRRRVTMLLPRLRAGRGRVVMATESHRADNEGQAARTTSTVSS